MVVRVRGVAGGVGGVVVIGVIGVAVAECVREAVSRSVSQSVSPSVRHRKVPKRTDCHGSGLASGYLSYPCGFLYEKYQSGWCCWWWSDQAKRCVDDFATAMDRNIFSFQKSCKL